MSNWSGSSFLNKEVLSTVIYKTDDNCAHLYNCRELYTISMVWLQARLEAFGLISGAKAAAIMVSSVVSSPQANL